MLDAKTPTGIRSYLREFQEEVEMSWKKDGCQMIGTEAIIWIF
jgi:hypothetical protein